MKNIIAVIVLLAPFISQIAVAEESAKKLFKKYIQLSESFDSSIANLYSDNAKIHAYRKYPYGTERAMELSGTQWKQLLVQALPIAKAQNDKSIFSDVTISKYGDGFKIKANRYSNRKCYTDLNYYMVVAPVKSNKLQIIEEYSETQPQSNC